MSPSAESYLISALREMDACSIPGLGTFRKGNTPARPSGDGSGLLPPSSYLTFDPSAATDAPSLADFLASRHQLTPADASRIMSDIKIEMMWALETRRKFDIQGLGLLMRSTEGNTVFIPYETHDPLGEQFGLLPVDLPAHAAPQISTQAAPPPPPAAPAPARTLVPAWLSSRIRTSLLVILLVGFTGFCLYMAFDQAPSRLEAGATQASTPDTNRLFGRSRQLTIPSTIRQDEVQQPEKAPAVSEPIASATVPQTGSGNPETATRGIEADPRQVMRTMRGADAHATEEYGVVGSLAELASNTPSSQPETSARLMRQSGQASASRGIEAGATMHYHLIGGSFSDLNQAKEAALAARNLGLTTQIIFPETPAERFRLSIVQGETKSEVRKEAERLKKAGHYRGAWILER